MPIDLLQDRGRLPNEHAAVPVEIARLEILGRLFGVGLLDELLDQIAVERAFLSQPPFGVRLNVAEARLRARRLDPKGDQVILLGQLGAQCDRLCKLRLALHHVIGRQHQHDGFRIAAEQFRGHQRDGRRGIAALRFDDEAVLEIILPLAQLNADRVDLRRVGRDDHAPRGRAIQHPLHRRLDQGIAPHDAEELFREVVPAERPESRAAAPGQNDGIQVRMWSHGIILFPLWPQGSNRRAPEPPPPLPWPDRHTAPPV